MDIDIFKKGSPFWWYFRLKEMALYKASDYIGCMSPANVNFLLKHNDFIDPAIVEIAPNSIELSEQIQLSYTEKDEMRKRYNLPLDKPVFIYGGNLGKPQGVSFLIECLNANKDRVDCHFLIIGSGTEYGKIEKTRQTPSTTLVDLVLNLSKTYGPVSPLLQ